MRHLITCNGQFLPTLHRDDRKRFLCLESLLICALGSHLSHCRALAPVCLLVPVFSLFAQTTGSQAPLVLSPPLSQITSPGGGVTFGVTYAGIPPFSFKWYFNGAPIPGATSSTLSQSAVDTNAVGPYSVEIRNAYGTANSPNAYLSLFEIVPSGALTITGKKGHPVLVAAIDDLQDTNGWQVVTNLVLADSRYTFQAGVPMTSGQRFFRSSLICAPGGLTGLEIYTGYGAETVTFISTNRVYSTVFDYGVYTLSRGLNSLSLHIDYTVVEGGIVHAQMDLTFSSPEDGTISQYWEYGVNAWGQSGNFAVLARP
jgi:hypothetical protein